MDFITDLPVSQGFSVILGVVDRFSKMGHFIPLKKLPSTPELAIIFIKEIEFKSKVSSLKLAPRFVGPFSVTRVINPMAYELALLHSWKVHRVFHKSLLKRYVVPPVHRVEGDSCLTVRFNSTGAEPKGEEAALHVPMEEEKTIRAFLGAEVKPMVTFTPDWGIIFQYESVTISCNVEFMAQENPRYHWSKDGKLLPHHHQRMIKLEPASEENGGTYQCWAKDLKSDPVRLDVVGVPLNLQAPPVIYLEEPLTLRCYSCYQRTNTTFFKNKTAIHFSVNDCELLFPSVDWSVAGSYSCSQQLFLGSKYKTFSASTIVSVRGTVEHWECADSVVKCL
ncbi:uncharacterized protein [Eleutherodactylus coqui]|uniref:uncharacterized protein n=1 Tax=Eleutherodactylus coqui TaxID=57060 RepID=UPI0034628132